MGLGILNERIDLFLLICDLNKEDVAVFDSWTSQVHNLKNSWQMLQSFRITLPKTHMTLENKPSETGKDCLPTANFQGLLPFWSVLLRFLFPGGYTQWIFFYLTISHIYIYAGTSENLCFV